MGNQNQFFSGMRAVHEWVRLNGYIEITIPSEKLQPPTILVIKGGTELSNAESALLIDIVTAQTLFTSGAKDAMYRAVDWKKGGENRSTVLFVTRGLIANAKEALTYDDYIEY